MRGTWIDYSSGTIDSYIIIVSIACSRGSYYSLHRQIALRHAIFISK